MNNSKCSHALSFRQEEKIKTGNIFSLTINGWGYQYQNKYELVRIIITN